jgi:hypothetical protein
MSDRPAFFDTVGVNSSALIDFDKDIPSLPHPARVITRTWFYAYSLSEGQKSRFILRLNPPITSITLRASPVDD